MFFYSSVVYFILIKLTETKWLWVNGHKISYICCNMADNSCAGRLVSNWLAAFVRIFYLHAAHENICRYNGKLT